MTTIDPFHEYRQSTASFTAVTGSDSRSLTLIAKKPALFHSIAHRVLTLANENGWFVVSIKRVHPGSNIREISVTPTRRTHADNRN
jgi:hypothetical protein